MSTTTTQPKSPPHADGATAVPPGYKRTEVGVIPVEWEVRPLEGIADPKRPICYGIVQVGRFASSGTPVLAIKNLNTDYRTDVHQCSPEIETPYARSRVRPGDILVSVKGTTGRVGIVPPHFHGNINRDLARMRLSDENVPEFWFQMLQSHSAQRELGVATVGTTRLELSIGILKQVKMPRPPSDEQRAIARTLSDVDELIGALEKLIAKKRAIKLAAMQQLLTGKTRLPGFGGKWGNVRLRDLLSYERPDRYIVQDSEYSERGHIPVLTANKSFILGYTDEDFGICRDVPAMIFDDFTTDNKYVDFPFKVKSAAIKLLRPKHERVDLRFVFDRMQLIHFPRGGHKRYYISEYQNLELEAPDHEEQQAIAIVLSDMDAEIAALKRRRDKTKEIKQGMMQSLLSGRVRLVNGETKA